VHWIAAGDIVRRLFNSDALAVDPVITGVDVEAPTCSVSIEVRGPKTPRVVSTIPIDAFEWPVRFERLEHRGQDTLGTFTELTICVETGEMFFQEMVTEYTLRIRLYAPDVEPLDTQPETVSQLMLPVTR
jgi:hypothetical protein